MTILEIIQREVKTSVDRDTVLEELGVDSLRAISILYSIEDELNIEIPNEAVDKLKTVGDILDLVDELT